MLTGYYLQPIDVSICVILKFQISTLYLKDVNCALAIVISFVNKVL